MHKCDRAKKNEGQGLSRLFLLSLYPRRWKCTLSSGHGGHLSLLEHSYELLWGRSGNFFCTCPSWNSFNPKYSIHKRAVCWASASDIILNDPAVRAMVNVMWLLLNMPRRMDSRQAARLCGNSVVQEVSPKICLQIWQSLAWPAIHSHQALLPNTIFLTNLLLITGH